ncbi:hypothetical protein KAR91_77845 [Candidatus Pacearchaeota archaeon]|nr:hypothetical protein [Candidatus Pacearchaeota archaeon]
MTIYFVNAGMPGVEAVNRAGRELELWESVDGRNINSFPREVKEEDIVIFGAWSNSYALYMRRLKCTKVRLVTSSLAQMEMAGGGIEQKWLEQDFRLVDKGVLDYIFFGSRDAYEYYKRLNKKVRYFPYPVYFEPTPLNWSQKEELVGLFMGGARKNQANQIASTHIASSETRFELFKVITNLNGWIPDDEYKELLPKLKALLFVSHAESFGYMAIDALEAGTLPIVSPCVKQNLDLWGSISVINPDSAIEISKKILDIINYSEDVYVAVLESNREKIHDLAEKNNQELREALAELTKNDL